MNDLSKVLNKHFKLDSMRVELHALKTKYLNSKEKKHKQDVVEFEIFLHNYNVDFTNNRKKRTIVVSKRIIVSVMDFLLCVGSFATGTLATAPGRG